MAACGQIAMTNEENGQSKGQCVEHPESIRNDAMALWSFLTCRSGEDPSAKILLKIAEGNDLQNGFFDDLWSYDASKIARIVAYILELDPSAGSIES